MCFSLNAQNTISASQLDSLNKLLEKPTLADTTKCDVLFQIGAANQFVDPYKAVHFLSEALALSRKTKDKKRILGNLVTLGYLFASIGESARSIDMLQESLHYTEDLHEDTSLALASIANGYEAQGDLTNAINYSRIAYLQFEKRRNDKLEIDERGYAEGPMRLGQLFEKANQLDSALHYAEMAYNRIQEKPIDRERAYFYCQICNSLGRIHGRLNENEEALIFYRLAYSKAIEVNFTSTISESQSDLAQFYFKNNQPDSVIFYATKAYEGAKQLKNFEIMKNSTALLRTVYEKKGRFDKALYYNDLSIAAKDSVYGLEKVREVQNLTHREERRQELKKQQAAAEDLAYNNKIRLYSLIALLSGVALIAVILFRNNNQKHKANLVLHQQKEEIDTQRNKAEKTLVELKATQNQLIQSEKLASLGELTAGIAHEIQNPLNFVNNFAELSLGLGKELKGEIDKLKIPENDKDYIGEILHDLNSNQEKINHHGKRAASIVSGMIEHSKPNTGIRELTDINKLCDEYSRLSFNSLKSKNPNFNVEMIAHFDESLPKIEIVPQDIGRVILNLVNNAFYAVNERNNLVGFETYKPTITVQTLQTISHIEIRIRDNGTGMSDAVKAKIFQPFFTTKPTGQGTGLGLSLAYDIITKGHGGTLKVESEEGVGTEMIIRI